MRIPFKTIKDSRGISEFEEFYKSLPLKDKNKLIALLKKVQEKGILDAISMKWVDKLDDNLFELRSKHANNIQRALYFHIYDTDYGSYYIITHGFTKKSQKTPQVEINRAKKIRDNFLAQPKEHIRNILKSWKEGE